MLDAAGKDVALHRPELVRDAVDDERLHPAQDDPELLVLVAVQRDDRAGLELEGLAYGLLRSTYDFHEGVEAFGEKRDPKFEGR